MKHSIALRRRSRYLIDRSKGGVSLGFWQIITTYSAELLSGLRVTFFLCAIAWTASFVIGIGLGALAARFRSTAGLIIRAMAAVLAGIPALVLLFWLHYPAQAALNVVIDPFITAAFALTLIGTFLVADAIRGVLIDFPRQYEVAARVAGLSNRVTFWRIRIPIVLRQFLPSALLITISILQMSLFASLISVDEIFRVAQRINSIVYRPTEIFTALALFCLAVSLPLYLLAVYLRAKFTRDFSET